MKGILLILRFLLPLYGLDKLPKAEEAEVDMIDMAFEPKKNSRLSCQLIVSNELDGLTVTTPSKQS